LSAVKQIAASTKARNIGLMQDAASLGVSPSHLWRCIKGERKSRRLMAAYRQLKSDTQETTP
jgi:hypothetical protein